MRYFAHISYNGTNYFGWQRQSGCDTVQSKIEDALASLFEQQIVIHGCGRTDTGVHASQYFFHFDLETEREFDLQKRLNFMLPSDIAVHEVIPVAPGADARHDATKRSYDYFFHTAKDPFLSASSAYYPVDNLDAESMAAAVSLLSDYQDYRAFCKSPDKLQHTTCFVQSASLAWNWNRTRFRFSITANRFLYRMIRLLVGTVISIGEGKISIEQFERQLSTGINPRLTRTAYPQGLYLSAVSYPWLDLPPRQDGLPLF